MATKTTKATKAEPTATDAEATADVTYVGSSPTGVEVKLSTGWYHVDHGETVTVPAADAEALLAAGETEWLEPAPAGRATGDTA